MQPTPIKISTPEDLLAELRLAATSTQSGHLEPDEIISQKIESGEIGDEAIVGALGLIRNEVLELKIGMNIAAEARDFASYRNHRLAMEGLRQALEIIGREKIVSLKAQLPDNEHVLLDALLAQPVVADQGQPLYASLLTSVDKVLDGDSALTELWKENTKTGGQIAEAVIIGALKLAASDKAEILEWKESLRKKSLNLDPSDDNHESSMQALNEKQRKLGHELERIAGIPSLIAPETLSAIAPQLSWAEFTALGLSKMGIARDTPG